MKKLHDLVHAHFNKSADNGNRTGGQKQGRIIKHVLLFHVGIVVILALVVLVLYFLR